MQFLLQQVCFETVLSPSATRSLNDSQIAVTFGGVGLHTHPHVPETDVEFVLKALIPMQVLYGIGLSLIKTSMIGLYWRLFGLKRSFRIVVYIVGVIVWGWGLSVALEAFLLCTPFESTWNQTIPGHCGNRTAAFIAAGVLNLLTDILVLSLPVTHIWKLQLRIGQKAGLIMVFSLGLLYVSTTLRFFYIMNLLTASSISAISIVRLVSLIHIDFTDATYTLTEPLMWTIIEQELALTTANLPLLRHIFAHILPRGWLASSRRKYNYNTNCQYRMNDSSRRREGDNLHNYNLRPMNPGVHQSDMSSSAPLKKNGMGATVGSVADDSDTELAAHGAPLDGIHVLREFQLESVG